MNLLLVLSRLAQLISAAKVIIPVVAAQRKSADPAASNAALANISKVVDATAPLVGGIEALSADHVAGGGPALSGVEKLAVMQLAVAQAHAVVAAEGGTTQKFDQVWAPIDAATTLICAVKAASGPAEATDAGAA